MFLNTLLYLCAATSSPYVYCEYISFNPSSKDLIPLIEDGKNHYMSIQKKTELPEFGSCWTDAVADLTGGCRKLNEEVQSEISLKFTDCFLETSGLDPYKCSERSVSRDECLKKMSDRDFHVYTEFYTHTQNMCFFLKSQIWHQETEETIDKLSTSSAQVASQLRESEQIQIDLLEQQKESVNLQNMLLENGKSLGFILEHSQANIHDVMEDFRSSIMEQRGLLFDVFERLSSLQAWAVGEISWFDTVLYYVSSIIVSYIVTALPRTQNARLWLFLAITLNAILERIICNYIVGDGTTHLETVNENLQWMIWFMRRIVIVACIILLTFTAMKYKDYNSANYQLLLQIQKQNSELMTYLANFAGLDKSNNGFIHEEGPESVETSPASQNINRYSRILDTPTPTRSRSSSPRTFTEYHSSARQTDTFSNFALSIPSSSSSDRSSRGRSDVESEISLSSRIHAMLRDSIPKDSSFAPVEPGNDSSVKSSKSTTLRKALNKTTVTNTHYNLRRSTQSPT